VKYFKNMSSAIQNKDFQFIHDRLPYELQIKLNTYTQPRFKPTFNKCMNDICDETKIKHIKDSFIIISEKTNSELDSCNKNNIILADYYKYSNRYMASSRDNYNKHQKSRLREMIKQITTNKLTHYIQYLTEDEYDKYIKGEFKQFIKMFSFYVYDDPYETLKSIRVSKEWTKNATIDDMF
jgi:hypothetical protein